MSESNPHKPTPLETSSEGAKPSDVKLPPPIPVTLSPKGSDSPKVSQPIKLPTLSPLPEIPAKEAPKMVVKPHASETELPKITIPAPKVELNPESKSRLGNWFKPKSTEPTAAVPPVVPPVIPPLVPNSPSTPSVEKPTPVTPPSSPIVQKEVKKGEKKEEEHAFPWVARDRSDEKPEIPPLIHPENLPKAEVVVPPPIPVVETPKPIEKPIEKPAEKEAPTVTEPPKVPVVEISTPPPVPTKKKETDLPPFLKTTAPSPMAAEPPFKKKTDNPPPEKVEPKSTEEKKPDLLSRKRYEEKGVSSDLPPSAPREKKPFPLWLRIIVHLLLYCAIGGAGYASYLHFRETRVEGKLTISNLRLDKKVLIVSDFSADVHVLASEYKERLQPVRDQIKDREDVARRARGDVSSIEERIRIVEQERGTVQKEVDLQIESGKQFQKKIWETEGAMIEKDYDRGLDLFEKSVQERVTGLQLKWEPGDIRSPEVWANAFRLSLYDAPKTVKNAVEREWIEKELQKWREFEKASEAKKEAIRERIDENQTKVNEKVIALKDRAQLLEIKVGEAQQELAPLKTELSRAESDLKESQDEEKGFLESYYKQIMELPDKNIRMTVDLRADQTFSWRAIHLNKAFPPGKYLMFIKAKKGDEDYWTLVQFPIIDFTKTEIEITQSAFVPVESYLKKK
jgi:hypothetical protein